MQRQHMLAGDCCFWGGGVTGSSEYFCLHAKTFSPGGFCCLFHGRSGENSGGGGVSCPSPMSQACRLSRGSARKHKHFTK